MLKMYNHTMRACIQITKSIDASKQLLKYNVSVNYVYEVVSQQLEQYTSNHANIPKDVRDLIFGGITDDATYKTLLQSKSVYKSKHFNQLWTLVNKYPDKEWDWREVLANPNTKESKIRFAMQKIRDENPGSKGTDAVIAICLAQNPNIKDRKTLEEFIPMTLKLWDTVSDISPFVFEIVAKNAGYDWHGDLSENPYITMGFVLNNPKVYWDISALSSNKAITLQNIEDNPYFGKDWDPWDVYGWNIAGLSENPNITFEYVEKYIDRRWDWHGLSSNPHVTIQVIKDHINKDWDWHDLSKNPSITMRDVEDTWFDKRYKWDINGLSRNPNITVDFVKKYMAIELCDWGWRNLSRSKAISIEDIEENLDLPWEWKYVFMNPNFTIKYAEKYKSKDEDFYAVFSSNPNLTEEFVSKYIDKDWIWERISANTFGNNT